MVEWETGLVWLVAVLFAARVRQPADTQHVRFAIAANRLMDVAPIASPALPGAVAKSRAPDYFNTGPPAALSCLSA